MIHFLMFTLLTILICKLLMALLEVTDDETALVIVYIFLIGAAILYLGYMYIVATFILKIPDLSLTSPVFINTFLTPCVCGMVLGIIISVALHTHPVEPYCKKIPKSLLSLISTIYSLKELDFFAKYTYIELNSDIYHTCQLDFKRFEIIFRKDIESSTQYVKLNMQDLINSKVPLDVVADFLKKIIEDCPISFLKEGL